MIAEISETSNSLKECCESCGTKIMIGDPKIKTLKKRGAYNMDGSIKTLCLKCLLLFKIKNRHTEKARKSLTSGGFDSLIESGHYELYKKELLRINNAIILTNQVMEKTISELRRLERRRVHEQELYTQAVIAGNKHPRLSYNTARIEANKAISDKELRRYIIGRDKGRCLHCGSSSRLSIDHIVPVIAGGSNDLSNLQTLCLSCNAKKGARIPDNDANDCLPCFVGKNDR
jgi:5-methylcytosine-specific restriction protein A